MREVVVMAFLFLGFCGCRCDRITTADFFLDGSATVSMYTSHGLQRTVPIVAGTPSSATIRKLDSWLALKKGEFYSSYATYAPVLVVSSDLCEVNFVGQKVVISLRTRRNDTWNQFEIDCDTEAMAIKQQLMTLVQEYPMNSVDSKE